MEKYTQDTQDKTDTTDSPLGRLLEGFKDCLNDLWTLEVNTMVVSDIGGFKFNPYSGYEKILALPRTKREFLDCLPWNDYKTLFGKHEALPRPQAPDYQSKVKEVDDLRAAIAIQFQSGNPQRLPSYVRSSFLRKLTLPEPPESVEKTIQSYVVLRQRLSRGYKAVKGDHGQTPNPGQEKDQSDAGTEATRQGVQGPVPLQDIPSLKGAETVDDAERNEEAEMAEIGERDPGPLPPLQQAVDEGLLDNGAFLRDLRSLRELFYLIGGEDATDQKTVNDLIFAQTIIEMDGDVMNRFHEQLLASQDREFLLSTHREAVSTGQENWQHLVTAIINAVQTLQKLLGF